MGVSVLGIVRFCDCRPQAIASSEGQLERQDLSQSAGGGLQKQSGLAGDVNDSCSHDSRVSFKGHKGIWILEARWPTLACRTELFVRHPMLQAFRCPSCPICDAEDCAVSQKPKARNWLGKQFPPATWPLIKICAAQGFSGNRALQK